MKDKFYFENITSVFCFGKHRGESLWSVIHKDQSYVYWCMNNISEFVVSEETLSQIRELFPDFIIPQNFLSHVFESSEMRDDY